MKRILVLNLIPNTIGDNIMLTPFLHILKKSTGAEIDFTVSSLNYLLFLNNPDISETYPIDELKIISDKKVTRPVKMLVYIKMIMKYSKIFRRKKYDSCYVMLPNFFLNLLIPYFSGIKNIIGYNYRGCYFRNLLTKKVWYRGLEETKDYERHFIESYFDLLRLSYFKWEKKDEFYVICLSENEEKNGKKLMEKLGIRPGKYVCFHTISKYNAWPIERFREVAKWIIKNTENKILLLGANSEYEGNEKIAKLDDRIINLCGKISLKEVAALLKHAKTLVCNDSGILHLTSAVGTQAIALYAGNTPKHNIPYGTGKVHIIYKFFNSFPYAPRLSPEARRRVLAITVDDVLEVAKKILEK